MIKGIRPTLAEGGKIKIGTVGERRLKRGRKGDSDDDYWRPPQKLDHFILTKTTRGRDGLLEVDHEMMSALEPLADADGKLRALPIWLHSDDLDEVLPTQYALYAGRKIACRGDGERAEQWIFDRQTQARTSETVEVACPCSKLMGDGRHVCKPNATLHCSIAVPGHAVAGSVHKWRTTSIISIQRLVGSLENIRDTVGTLRDIPLVLRLGPVETDKARVYCCHVELRASDLGAVQRQALVARRARAALEAPVVTPPAGDHETDEEQAEVAAEFYPPIEPDVRADRLASRVAAARGDVGHDPETGEVFDALSAADAFVDGPKGGE